MVLGQQNINKGGWIRMVILRCVWKVKFVIEIILNVEVGEARDSPQSDGGNVRNGTSVSTTHLDPR